MDQKYINLFDRFTHGGMNRRDFMEKLTMLAGSTAAATALLPLLENNYARADILPEGDPRIVSQTLELYRRRRLLCEAKRRRQISRRHRHP